MIRTVGRAEKGEGEMTHKEWSRVRGLSVSSCLAESDTHGYMHSHVSHNVCATDHTQLDPQEHIP